MPIIDFVCPKCGYRQEELVKIGQSIKCPKCGADMTQSYSGKCYVNTNKKQHCSGDCAHCKGCH